jgi:hypothetical protein
LRPQVAGPEKHAGRKVNKEARAGSLAVGCADQTFVAASAAARFML